MTAPEPPDRGFPAWDDVSTETQELRRCQSWFDLCFDEFPVEVRAALAVKAKAVHDQRNFYRKFNKGSFTKTVESDDDGDPIYDSLTYGEVPLQAMVEIVDRLKELRPADTLASFIDLGSGCGCAVLAAAFLHPFQRIVGVELLEGLHDVADRAKERWKVCSLNARTND